MIGWLVFCAVASARPLVVVHSQGNPAYAPVFEQIFAGIQRNYPHDIQRYRLQGRPFNDDDEAWLRQTTANTVIALGRDAYGLVNQSSTRARVLFGALPIAPEQGDGVSLLLEPKFLFNGLSDLLPDVKRVHVVYSESNQWLIALADKQARALGLILHGYPVEEYNSAAQTYEQLVPSLNSREDSIWIPLDPVTADERFILPQLLKQAWTYKLAVFSAKPALVKRGVLFSFFPDHEHIGETLAKQVNLLAQDPESHPFALTKKAKWVVNLRTAERIGLNLTKAQRKRFALTFPE